MRRKFIPVLIVGVTVLAAYVAVRAYIRHFETELTERKMARVTTGVVLDKKQVQFGVDQTEYSGR
jgi:hypothetical protein